MGDLSGHFDRSEFCCGCSPSEGCGGKFDTVDTVLLTMLEIIRQHFGVPVKITSGCRCRYYNDEVVKGSANSRHLVGKAADIQVQGIPPHQVQDYVDKIWPDSHGVGRYSSFTHIDSRDEKARW